jgi:hypothetical protein
MKGRVSLLYLLIMTGIISSCQRELDPELIVNKSNCASPLLVKAITKTIADSLVTEFEYDASGRPTRQFTTYFANPEFHTVDWTVIRNTSGIIVDMITKANKVQGTFYDTVHVFYDYSLKRYSYTVERFDLGGYITRDSIVYIYDASNKLIGQHVYLHHFTPGPYYLLDNKYEYTYNNEGSVSKWTNYERDQVTNVIGLRSVSEFTYDNKKRPRQIDPLEAIIFSYPYSTVHNVTFEKLTDQKLPVYSDTYTYQYTYNECDRPTTMTVNSGSGNYFRKVWYYYN